MDLFTKQTQRRNLWLLWERVGERDSQGVWEGQRHAAIFKMDSLTNKDLLNRTGNSAQFYVAAWIGESLGENGYMSIYG